MMPPNCILCSEPLAHLDVVGVAPGFAHRECALRSVLGGIGHHEDHDYWCTQRGDPDGGRSYHQSAIEVKALWDTGKIDHDGSNHA
jgi:hypothetical protein